MQLPMPLNVCSGVHVMTCNIEIKIDALTGMINLRQPLVGHERRRPGHNNGSGNPGRKVSKGRRSENGFTPLVPFTLNAEPQSTLHLQSLVRLEAPRDSVAARPARWLWRLDVDATGRRVVVPPRLRCEPRLRSRRQQRCYELQLAPAFAVGPRKGGGGAERPCSDLVEAEAHDKGAVRGEAERGAGRPHVCARERPEEQWLQIVHAGGRHPELPRLEGSADGTHAVGGGYDGPAPRQWEERCDGRLGVAAVPLPASRREVEVAALGAGRGSPSLQAQQAQ